MAEQAKNRAAAPHSALIKNERLKMYKRTSTWILIAVILALTVGTMFLMVFVESRNRQFYSSGQNWEQERINALTDNENYVRLNPDEECEYQKSQIEYLRYVMDHQIPPWDWRDSVAGAYSGRDDSVLYPDSRMTREENGEAETPAMGQERRQALWSILENKDWPAFLNLKKQDILDERLYFETDMERDLELELCDLYISNGIAPIGSTNYRGYADNPEYWKVEQLQEIKALKLSLLSGENLTDQYGAGTMPLLKSERRDFELRIEVALKRLSTDTPPATVDGLARNKFMTQMESSAMNTQMIIILLVILASTLVASEYNSGTIKLLLITPHKRQRIFWAKTRLLAEIALMMTAAFFLFAFLICGAFNGFQGIDAMQVVGLFGRALRMPYLVYILLQSLIMLLPALAYGAMGLMLAAVMRRNASSIAISLVLYFGSSLVVTVLQALRLNDIILPGMKFLLFTNLNPATLLAPSGNAMQNIVLDPTMTLGFSLLVLAVYTILFLWIARDSFCRRDVK